MTCYVFIPDADVSAAQKNRAVPPYEAVQVTIDSVLYDILEVDRADLVGTDVFDAYTWYDRATTEKVKDQLTFSPT